MQARPNYQSLYEDIGYTFQDESLLLQALTHRSAAKQHNERLEFLGDAVLGMVVAELLFNRFTQIPEGKLTRMRASLVKGDTLAEIGSQLNLGGLIKLGTGEKKSGGHRRASILADTVEAILGAIYFEAGFVTARQVIITLFTPRMEKLDPDAHPKDNKTRLQEWLQGRKKALPVYNVVSISGEDHAQTFVVECTVEGVATPSEGTANSRRRAEQNAARVMLGRLDSE